MPPRKLVAGAAREGLGSLRRAGTVADLLFLYECETGAVRGLREIATRLGLTVQAASHTYRGLARRGLVVSSAGQYRSTVKGVDWLHQTLGSIREDLAQRLDGLQMVRTTPALAAARIEAAERVGLSLRDGILWAAPGPSAGSRGVARASANAGEIVAVGELAGIIPLPPGRLRLLTFAGASLPDPRLLESLRSALSAAPEGHLYSFGLEAHVLLMRAKRGPPRSARFGVGPAVIEATRLGVDCTVVVVDREVPLLCRQLVGPEVPAPEFLALRPVRGAEPRRARHR